MKAEQVGKLGSTKVARFRYAAGTPLWWSGYPCRLTLDSDTSVDRTGYRRQADEKPETVDNPHRGDMSTPFDRISIDPNRMNGQPCIRGMRLTVRRVVEAVALYPDRLELRREYPELEDNDIRQTLEFAASNLDDQVFTLGAT